jgi:hypothetical protein
MVLRTSLMLLILLTFQSLSFSACKGECDYWYSDCLNDTHHTSNDVSGGADDVYPAYKYGVVNLYYCGKYDSSFRQEFMQDNPGFDVGQCDCAPSYLACLKSLYEKYSTYEETGAHAKQCAVPAASCYNAFRSTTCPIEKAACYERCGIPNTGGTTGTGTGSTSSGGSTDPCATKSCDKDSCKIVGGEAIWYSGGTCVKGECQYNALVCKSGCNKDGDGCKQEVKVDVFVMEPYDNQRIDSKGGPASVNVVGIARGASEADVSNVMVSVPGVLLQKSISMSGDRFSGTVDLPGPGKYTVKVEARGSDGSILSSAESNVEVGASFSEVVWRSDAARLMRKGKEVPIESGVMKLQEGDEITIESENGGYIDYSDGTQAILNPGTTVRKGKGDSVTILLGNVQIDGNFAHNFDTRFGDIVMKGTSFTIDVDDFRTRVKVSKGAVGIFSLYDSVGTVQAGQYGDIMRNGDITVYSSSGQIVESSAPTGHASPMDPSTHEATGCGGAFILAAVAFFSTRR